MELLDTNVLKLKGARSKLFMLSITGVVDAICILVQGISLGAALSLIWQGAGTGTFDVCRIAFGAICFLVGYIARQAISFGRAKSMNAWARMQANLLQEKLAERCFDAGPAFVQKNGTSNITASMIEGTDRIENYLEIILPKVTDLIVVPVVLSIGLFTLDWVSGIIAIVMIPFIALYMKMLGRGAREAAQKQHGSYVRLGNHFMDAVRGIRTLAYFGRIKTASKEVYAVSERARKASLKTIQVATLSSLVLDLFRTFALAAIAIMLGFRLMGGGIALFNALAVLIIVPEYFAAIRRFSTDFHASLDGKTQLAATLHMIDKKSAPQKHKQTSLDTQAAENSQDKTLSEAQICKPQANSLHGVHSDAIELTAQKISYTYTSENASHEDWALNTISFSTGGARKIGIVGVSGSGKSTLARILAGFASPTQGTIFVNGKPFDLCSSQWQKSVAYIPQNPHLFHGSVRDNITFYCPDAPDSGITQAICAAGLNDVIADLPEGLSTTIGEGGRQLSGGQAQRIALARAFLDTKRRIVVFDEPTAHLDLETEYALKKTMLPLIDNRLVFFATHRIHWMRDMDLLLVLDQGNLIEAGSFEELYSHNGAFSKLVRQLSGSAVC